MFQCQIIVVVTQVQPQVIQSLTDCHGLLTPEGYR